MSVSLVNKCWKDFIKDEQYAFRMLYDMYADKLFSFGCRYCTDEDMVKDGIHDLFVDLHTYRFRLSPEVNVDAYLFSALRRKLMAIAKKKQAHREIELNEMSVDFFVEWNAETAIIHNEAQREVLTNLSKELNHLSSRQREVLYLRFTSELGYEEVAQVMDISVATCRTLVYRAIRQLRERMNVPVSNLLFILFKKQP